MKLNSGQVSFTELNNLATAFGQSSLGQKFGKGVFVGMELEVTTGFGGVNLTDLFADLNLVFKQARTSGSLTPDVVKRLSKSINDGANAPLRDLVNRKVLETIPKTGLA